MKGKKANVSLVFLFPFEPGDECAGPELKVLQLCFEALDIAAEVDDLGADLFNVL